MSAKPVYREEDVLTDCQPLAVIQVRTPVSIIVPTYQERESLPLLLERIRAVRERHDIDLELIVMDDDSQDGTQEWAATLSEDWVNLVVRKSNRGLSNSVVDGLRIAANPVVVVMDADLSHPPECIPKMILALESGQDFVIGSRYVRGGSTDDEWGFFRWLNSQIATLLAKPLVSARDPMAGFFALRREDIRDFNLLNPIGYKIGLELIVKCGLDNIGEVPIHFADRQAGESKLNFQEQLKYIKHLRRLYIFKYAGWSSFAQFLVVGALGTVVNLSVVATGKYFGLGDVLAISLGIALSLVHNFVLNRRYTFSYARDRSWPRQFAGFLAACSVGAAVQWLVAVSLVKSFPGFSTMLAALTGIGAGTAFNFVANRFLVFKRGKPLPQ